MAERPSFLYNFFKMTGLWTLKRPILSVSASDPFWCMFLFRLNCLSIGHSKMKTAIRKKTAILNLQNVWSIGIIHIVYFWHVVFRKIPIRCVKPITMNFTYNIPRQTNSLLTAFIHTCFFCCTK